MGKRTYTYDGSEWVGLTSTTADLSNYANLTNTPISGFRNAIINGGFDIWQRGTTATATSNSYTSADRWVNTFDGSSSATTISRQSFIPGNTISGYEPEYFLRYAQTSAGSGGSFRTICQRIENVRTFAGQTVTLSFWAKADSDRILDTRIRQNFGSGGSANVDTNGSSINLTTSWSRYFTTITLPSISGKTIGTGNMLEVFLFLPLNTTQTIDIWGVQLEKGTIATPFEQRPFGLELTLCKRYYEKSYPYAVVPGTAGTWNTNTIMSTGKWSNALDFRHNFTVEKFRVPDMVFYNPVGGSTSNLRIENMQINNTDYTYNLSSQSYTTVGFMFRAVMTSATEYREGGSYSILHYTANAEL